MHAISGTADCGCNFSGESSGNDFVAEDGRRSHYFFITMPPKCPYGKASHGTELNGAGKKFYMHVQDARMAEFVDKIRDEDPDRRVTLQFPRLVIKYDLERQGQQALIVV